MALFSKKNNYYYINSNHQIKNNELEEALTLAADGIGKFALNDEMTILYFNQGLCDLVGEKAEGIEEAGFNSTLYVHEDDLEYIKMEFIKITE